MALEPSNAQSGVPADGAGIVVRSGYAAGLIGRCTALHATYYAREAAFGLPFEAKVATELAAFMARLDRAGNGFWHAVAGDAVAGTVAIDGEDLGGGVAHLRWFIVADGERGRGTGRRLLAAALGFCDTIGLAETRLWTFRGLDVARRLYEAAGFELAAEAPGQQWGREVMEQQFLRRRPAALAGGS